MFKNFFIISFIFLLNISANLLQKTINDAPPYSTLKLPAGIYKGNIIITKPITILGKEKGAIIEGIEQGDVITIKSSHVKLENLKIIKSGKRKELSNSAVFAKNLENLEIKNCTIQDSLFGLFLDNVNFSKFINNKISSIKDTIDLRGDAIKMWFCHNNIIKNNSFVNSRDIALINSNNNIIANNYIKDCRYSVFSNGSKNNKIIKNNIENGSVGIFIQNSSQTDITDNIIKGSLGSPTSLGILIKESSNTLVKQNSIGECNQAIFIYNSPIEYEIKNSILNNKIMYNTRGLDFKGYSLNNVIRKNELIGNMDNIMTDNYHGMTNENNITGNYWDDYEGFDLNKDNIGDTSYIKSLYFDQVWIKYPKSRFFYGSPIISILNFMLKIAPFMKPVFLIEDKKPIFQIEK